MYKRSSNCSNKDLVHIEIVRTEPKSQFEEFELQTLKSQNPNFWRKVFLNLALKLSKISYFHSVPDHKASCTGIRVLLRAVQDGLLSFSGTGRDLTPRLSLNKTMHKLNRIIYKDYIVYLIKTSIRKSFLVHRD